MNFILYFCQNLFKKYVRKVSIVFSLQKSKHPALILGLNLLKLLKDKIYFLKCSYLYIYEDAQRLPVYLTNFTFNSLRILSSNELLDSYISLMKNLIKTFLNVRLIIANLRNHFKVFSSKITSNHTSSFGVNGKSSPLFNLFSYNICNHKIIDSKGITKNLPHIQQKDGVTVKTFLKSKHIVFCKNTSVTLNKEVYKIQKRYHSANALVNNLTKKIISPQVLMEQRNILKNKAIFMRYCEHFKNKTLSDLLNDKIFIQQMHNSIHGEPTLFSRAFQLALEVTYSKRRFDEQALKDMYKHDFIVEDSFGVNKGLCDQSTVYNCVLAKKVCFYFNLEIKDIVVNSTPIFLNKEKITETMKISMDYNKKMTENTCPDLNIRGRPYDFKESKDISFSKNQIYFIDMEEIRKKGVEIFFKLEKSLEKSLNNTQISLSEKSKEFTNIIIENLKKQRESLVSIEMRVESLNLFLIKNNIPKDFKMPLFIPIKKASIEMLDTTKVDQVPLDPGFLNQTKAKKAIMGVLDTYDDRIKTNIQEITHGSIQFNIPKIEEID